MKTAGEIMTPAVLTVGPDTDVDEAIEILVNSRITGLPVVDDDGRLLGIFTETDRLKMYSAGQNSEHATVGEVMTRGVITLDESTTLEQISDILLRASIRRMPVTRDGKVIGVVSRRDVLRAARELQTAGRAG